MRWRSIMKCEDVRLQLPDYTLGTPSDTGMVAVRRQLRGCSGCRSEAARLDEGVALFATAAHAVEPPAELQDRVLSVLAHEWDEAPAAMKPRRARAVMVRWQALA